MWWAGVRDVLVRERTFDQEVLLGSSAKDSRRSGERFHGRKDVMSSVATCPNVMP